MAEDASTPTTSTRPEEPRLSFPRLLLVRIWSLWLDAVNRAADLAVLAWRPRLLGPALSLWLRELLVSPYRPRRSFEVIRLLQVHGQGFDELMYGETPVHTALGLFQQAGLTAHGHLVDLGAGRGRALLAARWLGARATGIELLREHVTLASAPLSRAGAVLRQGDAALADLGEATHVLVNWTALSPQTRTRLVARLRTCRPGTRVLTVTRPIEAPGFTVRSRHRALFTWGLEPVWIHEVPDSAAQVPTSTS
ncbi:hypothetical protein SAMN05443572_114127 [Myxococcus fulvus]|uniref:Methyltransferase n=1 Tax=Myxococcus fulvus TaxID=33 RepID=A0A511TAR4_MYXFU|nr:class I SAM-dependent methyltransferase [Myxococcus fulvus]GEN11279.1 hypothetical protein MFU01_63160 [Myxococcus fulvus]SEU39592.1 hypothetical protein SAMN05443572_114127 [Myxococcus fulvus]